MRTLELKDHFPLREVCYFNTGGAADLYITAETVADLIESVQYCYGQAIPFHVLGEGATTLFSDSGFPGLVVHNKAQTVYFLHDRSQVIVDSGALVRQIVAQTVSLSYSGLEFLAHAPGTVGGALFYNRSLFGYQIGNYVKSATVLFPGEKEPRIVDREWFRFSSGSSYLKELKQQQDSTPVILSVTFQLSKMKHESCMQRLKYFQSLEKDFYIPPFPSLQLFDTLTSTLIPSGTVPVRRPGLLKPSHYFEKAKLLALKEGDIEVCPANPNFIINAKVGTSSEARIVIEKLKQLVKDTYAVDIEPLIDFAGAWF